MKNPRYLNAVCILVHCNTVDQNNTSMCLHLRNSGWGAAGLGCSYVDIVESDNVINVVCIQVYKEGKTLHGN